MVAKVLDQTLRASLRVVQVREPSTDGHHWLRAAKMRDDAWDQAVAHVAAEVTNALTTGAVLVDRDTLDQWIEDALTQGIAPASYVFGVLSAAVPEDPTTAEEATK